MDNYLGEFPVDIKTTEFKDYGPKEWALHYIFMYAQIDGGHHKMWVLDQVARILAILILSFVENWETHYFIIRMDTTTAFHHN